jgi:membrane dipeptidase
MVPFVTTFISQARRTWDLDRSQREAALRPAALGDSARVARELAAWDQSHPRPVVRIADVADQIEYIRRITGPDHLGIGSDFDGITETIEGLSDVASYPALFAELARRGWTEADLRKLAGENILRAMARAQEVAMRLRRERPASTRTIRELDRHPGAD